ncbi:putative ribonuclease H1 [Rosellinia necatrix]|uniref:Putative ribonuclease H1 n=1 Tax=Rosellinia necatrix TaxID=77044 RepID=A0A1S8A7C3_ROSNE|nr:putative ribonuclease H1 [Rosellinia necatrix]
MVYVMQFRVDRGCRLSGSPTAVGAAACCLMKGREGYRWRAEALPREPAPTKERADIEAVVMALQWALERYDDELR